MRIEFGSGNVILVSPPFPSSKLKRQVGEKTLGPGRASTLDVCSSTLNWGRRGGGGKYIFSFICPMYGLRLGAQIQNKFINSKSDSHYNSHRCTHPKNRFLKPEPQLKWAHHPSRLLARPDYVAKGPLAFAA